MFDGNVNPEDMSREDVKAQVQAAAQKVRNGEQLTQEEAEWLFSYAAALELRSAMLTMQLSMARMAIEALVGDGNPQLGGFDIEFENN